MNLSATVSAGEAALFAAAYGDGYNITSAILLHYGSVAGYWMGDLPYLVDATQAPVTPTGNYVDEKEYMHMSTSSGLGGRGKAKGPSLPKDYLHKSYPLPAILPPNYHPDPPVPKVPTIMFTGTKDDISYPNETLGLFEHSLSSGLPLGVINKVGATSDEPLGLVNLQMALFIVAWAKIYQRTPLAKRTADFDWNELIFGSGPASVCGGADGKLQHCSMVRGSPLYN